MRASSAGDRERLAGPPMLLGVAFALGALLATVLPTRREFADATDARPDAYSLAYLEVATHASPGDPHLRRAYVRDLTALGRFDAAFEALRGAVVDPQHDPETASVRFDLLLARARALPDGSAARTAAFEEVAHALDALARAPLGPARLGDLATVALSLERPRLAAELLVRRASVAPGRERAPALAEAGKWFLASGDAARAADAFRAAADAEADEGRARTDAWRALDALEASGDTKAAADLAQRYVGRYADDAALVERAAALAGATGRVDVARDLGRALLARRPDDEALVAGQARRELAAGDPASALPLLERLERAHPDDVRWHAAMARVAEWSGRPEEALRDWMWLVEHGVASTRDVEWP